MGGELAGVVCRLELFEVGEEGVSKSRGVGGGQRWRTAPENPAKLKPRNTGPSEMIGSVGCRLVPECRRPAGPRQGKGLAPSLTTSLWPSWAWTSDLDGFPRCAEPNRRAALNSTGGRRVFVLTQTQMDSKLPLDKAKGLMSWQRGICTACCPDILSERANSHKWPPSAFGLRTQTLIRAREVPLRPDRTARFSREVGTSQ